VPPENLKRGKLPAPVAPLPSGTQGIGGPSANEGGEKRGSRGLSPLAGGLGDVPPENLKRGKLPAPVTLPPSGTQGIGGLSANEGGEKGGSRGLSLLAGGLGDVPPENLKRGKLPAPVTPPPSGTQGISGPSANEGGKGGPGGVAPWQGAWGMCPQKTLKGGSCQPL